MRSRFSAPSLSWWDGSARALLDVAFAVATGLLSHASVRNPLGLLPYGPATPVVTVSIAAAFLVRRRFPITVSAVAAVGCVLTGTLFGPMLAAYTIASQRGNARTTWIVGGAVAVVTYVPWGVPDALNTRGPLSRVPIVLAFVAVPMLFGLWVAQRRLLVASLRERAEQAKRERDGNGYVGRAPTARPGSSANARREPQ